MKMAPSNKSGRKKTKYVCFDCRLSFKDRSSPCPVCGQALMDVGPRFRAPPRRDIKEWAIMKIWWADTRVLKSRNGIHVAHGPKQDTVRAQREQLAKDREYSHSHKITGYTRSQYSAFPYVTFK